VKEAHEIAFNAASAAERRQRRLTAELNSPYRIAVARVGMRQHRMVPTSSSRESRRRYVLVRARSASAASEYCARRCQFSPHLRHALTRKRVENRAGSEHLGTFESEFRGVIISTFLNQRPSARRQARVLASLLKIFACGTKNRRHALAREISRRAPSRSCCSMDGDVVVAKGLRNCMKAPYWTECKSERAC
jgi:hypothetical protein